LNDGVTEKFGQVMIGIVNIVNPEFDDGRAVISGIRYFASSK
jgi:hypothetical protein